jgi:hypothetical protein
MKNKNTICHSANFIKSFGKTLVSCLIISAVIVLNSCVDFEEPNVVYDPSYPKTNDPVITGVTPAGITLGGVREIQISGQNLGVKGSDTDWVFIGGVRATIKDIIGTQTIVIHRPQLAAGNYDSKIYINVTAPKAIATSSSFEYMVENPGQAVGNYGTNFGGNVFLAVDFDNQENIYIATSRAVWRNDPSGNTLAQMAGNFPRNPFASISDAKLGPGTPGINMYLACGTNTIYRVRADSVQTGTVRPAAVDTLLGNVSKLDFDINGNIYSGGSDGVFLTKLSDGSTSQSLGYEGTTNIKGLRIVYQGTNGFIYIADSVNVWRSQINSDGTLNGTKEILVDLGTNPALSSYLITSFEIDENGGIYLCINHPNYRLYYRESDGSIGPYYYDAGILPNTVEQITWGTGNYLYLISSSLHQPPPNASLFASDRLYRMKQDKNGAAYQGRSFLP